MRFAAPTATNTGNWPSLARAVPTVTPCLTRVQVKPSSREMYKPAACTETSQKSGCVSKASAKPPGSPAWALLQLFPASREMYKPVRATASKVLSLVHSSRIAPPDSSGRSCQAQVCPASSEKIIPPDETSRISRASLDARTEATGNSPGPKGNSAHFLPESCDTKSPCSVAANQAESPKNISFTTGRKARSSPFTRGESLVEFAIELSGTTATRAQVFRRASNRARPPEASAAHQPDGDEKICRTASPSSPALIAAQLLPPSSVISSASGAFSRTAAARSGSRDSTASDTMR